MTGQPAPLGPGPFAGFSAMLAGVARDGIARLIGPNAGRPVLGALSAADLGVAAAFLLAALAATGIVWAALRGGRRGEASGLGGHVITAVRKPLILAIWIAGTYCALIALVARVPGAAGPSLRGIADRLLALGLFAALVWGAQRGTHVLDRWLGLWAAKTKSRVDDVIAMLVGRSLRIVVPVLGVIFGLPILGLPARFSGLVATGTSLLLIVAVAWAFFEAIGVAERTLLASFDLGATDNLRARKVYTQVHVIGRTIRVAVGVFAAASVLMLFSTVREFGTSLLASAGIVGIVAGIAAQKPLSNLFAGIQIALTQPMRQDDVVVVEGEWGRIEEITLSYVVVRIWDDRRLVVPLGYFIEKPFQNWTRSSSALLGSVYVWVDYSFPVERGREALKGIIEGNPLWDGRAWNLQVTDANERSMQLRVLATAADSSKSWDLRCQIREQFIDFIQRAHPRSLPLIRAETAPSA